MFGARVEPLIALRDRFTLMTPYHQNTTRLVTTSRHVSILVGTNFPAAEYKTALADTWRHVADGLNPDL
jgi:hypothetical protein